VFPQLFSAPKFLLARPDNYLLVMQLVDTLNNLVQYQHEGNTQLLYSIVLKKHCIERVRMCVCLSPLRVFSTCFGAIHYAQLRLEGGVPLRSLPFS
jgi:hypothetical protein